MNLSFFVVLDERLRSIESDPIDFRLQLTEIVFWKYEDSHETIEMNSETSLVQVKVSDRHQEFVDASMAHFNHVVSKNGRVF